MPKTNRSDTFYFKLPEGLATSSIPDAKLQVSVNFTAPKGFEKVAQKIITDVLADSKDTFKKRMKKAINDMEEDF